MVVEQEVAKMPQDNIRDGMPHEFGRDPSDAQNGASHGAQDLGAEGVINSQDQLIRFDN